MTESSTEHMGHTGKEGCPACKTLTDGMSLPEMIEFSLEIIKAVWQEGDGERAHELLHSLADDPAFMAACSSEQRLKILGLQSILCDDGSSNSISGILDIIRDKLGLNGYTRDNPKGGD